MNVLTRRSGSLVVFYTLKSLSRWEIGLTEWIIDTFQLSGHGLPTNTNSDQVSDIRYGIGTMANDVEEAEELLVEHDYSLLNILGIARTVKKGLRKLHTFFCGFWLQEPGNRATDRKTEPVAAALQHIYPHKWQAYVMRLWDICNYNLAPTNAPWTYLMRTGLTWHPCHESRCCGARCKSLVSKST